MRSKIQSRTFHYARWISGQSWKRHMPEMQGKRFREDKFKEHKDVFESEKFNQ